MDEQRDTREWAELGPLKGAIAAREERSRTDHARLLERDPALWPGPASSIAPWLGWVDGIERSEAHLSAIRPLVSAVLTEGIDHVVLVGMGGSSLFPLVLTGTVVPPAGHPTLRVLDSTDPAAVARIERSVDWERTLVVASSKSGTTVETLAHLDRLLQRLQDAVGPGAADRVVVVTDPGSPLEARAVADGLRGVVHGDPDVGGRYSALSPFGLLPATLMGADTGVLIDHARSSSAAWRADPWSGAGPARLAAFLAAGVDAGRDALHLLVDPRSGPFAAWIEQLVAESSGKDGTGVLPVIVDRVEDVVAVSRALAVAVGDNGVLDALRARGVPTLHIPWVGGEQLGSEVVRWTRAVALACAQLGVNPFDQPDVAAAKAATVDALIGGSEPDVPIRLATLEEELSAAGYVALLAYVDPDGSTAEQLRDVARRFARRHQVPVTVGIGPRYLHSTGQLHKGGRRDGVFLFVIGDDPHDVPIPGRSHGFSRLKRAQAAGDLAALREAGRRAEVVELAALLDVG